MVFSVGGSQIYHLDIIYDISYRVLERTLDKKVNYEFTNIIMNIIIKNRLYMYICIQLFGREWHFQYKNGKYEKTYLKKKEGNDKWQWQCFRHQVKVVPFGNQAKF